ncbi:MAG: alpha/beta fold hydrolase [Alphaproteobacteria bacterium]
MIDRRLFLGGAIALSACTTAAPKWSASPSDDVNIVRDYVDGPFGQLHYYEAGDRKSRKTPLVLFHPTAVSGDYFHDYMLEMAKDRFVVALDTPGYGKSDPPSERQSMTKLADALGDGISALGLKKVDLLGYHTGCYLATELAILRPDMVRRLLLPGIPYYTGAEQEGMYKKNARPKPIAEDGADAQKIWSFWVTNRNKAVPLERGVEHFTDHIQSYPRSNWAYHSVFTYDADARLPLITQPVLVPNTHGSLKEESRQAAALIPGAVVIEIPELHEGVFDIGVPKLVSVTRSFLDE